MPIETAAYLTQLDATNPPATDQMAEGDDHIRLVKATIKATFPNFTAAALAASQAQLDSVVTQVLTGPFAAPADGSVATPAITRATDPNTGFYFPAADQMALAAGGVQAWLATSTGLTIPGNLTVSGTLTAGSGLWDTGDVKLTLRAVAPAGWLMFADQTIGNTGSGATYAATAAHDLYVLLWTNISDTYAPVTGGRGASAEADWTAQKKLALVKTLGRALGVAGAGSGLTSRALAQALGEETHLQTIGEMPAHSHTANVSDPGHTHTASQVDSSGSPASGGFAGNFSTRATGVGFTGIGVTNTNTGGGGAFNVMQPTAFLNAMVKL